MNVNGKTILVTGAASGIGEAAAALLVNSGARVIAVDRAEVNLPGLTGRYRADLADPSSIDALVRELRGEKLDGIANIAGASNVAPIEIQFAVNFLGPRHLIQSLSHNFSVGASVVNMASGTAIFWRDHYDQIEEMANSKGFEDGFRWLEKYPQERIHSYARSKEVMVFWTLQTAKEWAGSGRRINAISPGPVETPMLKEFRQVVGDEVIDADAKRSGRAGTPGDIAPVVAFLMSDQSAWVHGVNLPVDGGFSASVLTNRDGWAY